MEELEMKEFKVGDSVFVYYNKKIAYRRIMRINAEMVEFYDGCPCNRKIVSVPLESVFETKEELKNYIEKEN